MYEVKKIFLRFFVSLIAILICSQITFQDSRLEVLVHKTILVLWAIIISEFIWYISYKPFWGKTEYINDKRIQGNILIFRAIFVASIILGFTLGI